MPTATLDPEAPTYHAMNTLLAQPSPPSSQLLPTIAQVSKFLSSYLPPKSKDVDFVYHTPHYRPKPSAPQSQSTPSQPLPQPPPRLTRTLPSSSALVYRLILSITPTPGVYTTLSTHPAPSTGTTLAFLHRPFLLDRRRVPRGVWVLSSHTSFDEVLTVGYNTHLARRLSVEFDGHRSGEISEGGNGAERDGGGNGGVGRGGEQDGVVCLKGYKNDPERKIGLVGRFAATSGGSVSEGVDEDANEGVDGEVLLERIRTEFGSWDSIHGFDYSSSPTTAPEQGTTTAAAAASVGDQEKHVPEQEEVQNSRQKPRIRFLAIMNAFHPEEVDRVLQAAASKSWISGSALSCSSSSSSDTTTEDQKNDNATAQAEEEERKTNEDTIKAEQAYGGIGQQILYLTGQARPEGLAAATQAGMRVVCVGHRVCEEWGIRFLAEQVGREFRGSGMEVVVVEEEEEVVVRPSKAKKVKIEGVGGGGGGGGLKMKKEKKEKKQKESDVNAEKNGTVVGEGKVENYSGTKVN